MVILAALPTSLPGCALQCCPGQFTPCSDEQGAGPALLLSSPQGLLSDHWRQLYHVAQMRCRGRSPECYTGEGRDSSRALIISRSALPRCHRSEWGWSIHTTRWLTRVRARSPTLTFLGSSPTPLSLESTLLRCPGGSRDFSRLLQLVKERFSYLPSWMQ